MSSTNETYSPEDSSLKSIRKVEWGERKKMIFKSSSRVLHFTCTLTENKRINIFNLSRFTVQKEEEKEEKQQKSYF